MIKIQLKCFATLANIQPKNANTFAIKKGSTLKDLMKKIDLDENLVKIIFVNGKIVPSSTKLRQNDRVGFFPAVGGG